MSAGFARVAEARSTAEERIVAEENSLTSTRRGALSQSETRSVESRARSERRVTEYLHTLGLTDATRIAELIKEVSDPDTIDVPAAEMITRVQDRLEAWRSDVFGADAEAIEPLWLRAFASAHPHAFLSPAHAARAAVQAFGDPRAGKARVRARFRDQAFVRANLPRWLVCLLLPTTFTAAVTFVLLVQLAHGGFTLLELSWACTFAVLLWLGAVGLFAALIGFVRDKKVEEPVASGSKSLPRTALLMPIYHEDPEHVFAALLAMRESLANVPGGEAFEMFVLSDSRMPERAAEEERAFRRVAALSDRRVPIYYRRRVKNDRQKAGNLAEFFERWGHRYQYAVILDADSLMRGDTLVTLVERMERSPSLALLHAPLHLHGGRTLFARALQLATSVHGPILTRGLSRWAGPDGNYFGHNAIVRVKAFLECCALPVLAGKPPFGGHILSHDFVEAALLCRAGWQVRIAHELTGSWEELPPTLPEYVARDRRWCQGNFQHLQIMFAAGLKPMSRLHMLVGALMYVASPLWLCFVVLGGLLVHQSGGLPLSTPVALGLLGVTCSVLFGPRILGFLSTFGSRESRKLHGGALGLFASVVAETAFAAMLSPILMLHHTRIVLDIVLGRTTSWGAQNRHGSGNFGIIARHERFSTLLGLATALGLYQFAPALFVWLSPLWVSWLLSIPLVAIASSEWAGKLARTLGLLRTPPEVAPDPLLSRARELRALTAGDEVARFRDLVLDPVLLHAHIQRLQQASAQPPKGDVESVRQRALRVGPAALSAEERTLLSSCPESMKLLHRDAWRSWPVETWQLGRDLAQLPPD